MLRFFLLQCWASGAMHKFVRSSVFTHVNDQIRIRFRIDETIHLEVAPEAQRAVFLMRQFVEDPDNQVCFKLQPRQTLVTDNTRVLHGRTAYDAAEPRCMYRMHLDGMGSRGPLRIGFQAEVLVGNA